MLKSSFKYFILTIKHKWFVFWACRKVGVSLWRSIKHDFSKFYPSELPYYGQQFFGEEKDPEKWAVCWLKHQNRNDHHWEYWIPRTSCGPYKDGEPLPMPEQAIREMIADWLGAGRAYEGRWPDYDNWIWLNENLNKLVFHPDTRKRVEEIVENLKG